MATGITDIPRDILQTHILPRLDGRSLSTTTAVSPHLHHLCSDHTLWVNITNSTWPSITHPRVHDVISTFPSGHRSFFHDSFPALFTDVVNSTSKQQPDCSSSHPSPSEFISAVDIRYQNDIVYSTVKFTDTTSSDFLSSGLRIGLNDDPDCYGSGSEEVPVISRSIELEVDEISGADEATLSHLKESVTLNWVLIDPTRKRAGNLSSVKPVSVRQDWMCNQTVLKYVVVLPGSDPNEMVQCKIQLVLGVGNGGVGLHVKHVTLILQDLDCRCLSGREFLVIMKGAILEENNVRRKVMDDRGRRRGIKEFKEIKRVKKVWERMEGEKQDFAIKMNYLVILVSFCFLVYFLILLLQ
ncbi:hypothetical protein L1987_52172 [Smallanthus sonchifolius]|uniref:Uncharacterized protein n=1 Tax=Smallanthus sonchifolius TaxID=185202 RepID=A0ACB9ESZ6_9ASTR|nr:hypothetical protein L1987_52172 [Smallanthus sonchifolius]